ncbi:MAG TPA: zf-TFIIB domain-containing protein [Phycisphaerae bacterium]|nr:zf-TFIIB domain-containing protein [Phycisphaerae bacterium]
MCPACGEPLLLVELDAIEIDLCLACRGIWLDRGELAMIVQHAYASAEDLRLRLEAFIPGPRSQRRCPRCRKRLRCSRDKGTPDLEIEECPRGHGYWLDHGEIEKLVQSRQDGSNRPIAAFLAAALEHELSHSKKGD